MARERTEREKAQRECADALSGVVKAVTTAMESRDRHTAGHQGRVAEIACAIAVNMGWDGEQLQALEIAALVHDVGKISVPAEVLTKPGKLTADEFAHIIVHPETGYQILKDIPFHWPIAEAVRQHHERLDGSGYPRGLKGDEILPMARIVAVADMLDAMVSTRPYRTALPLEVALGELELDAGTRLDAQVVKVCVDMLRDTPQPRSA
jgi:HD-GYP domain-containing protein (c-di-GMP phosphodiesterase class II)